SRVDGSAVGSTPMRDQERGDIVPVEDIVQIDRRNRLLRQFKDTPVVYTLDDFLSNIGLLDAYDTFVGSANAVNLFESLAQAAPYLDGTKLKTTEDQEDNETAKSFVASKKSDEAALMAYFFVLCRKRQLKRERLELSLRPTMIFRSSAIASLTIRVQLFQAALISPTVLYTTLNAR
ncbi:hypothetical protein GGI22_006703, partial [Coemansia erecta]